METLIYIAKGCGILAIFYTVYVLFLAKETFYGNNRRFLNLGVLSAFVLPFLIFKKEVYLTLNAQDLVNSSTSSQTLENVGLTTADYLEIVLLSVYLLGVSLMIIRLLLQMVKIFSFLRNQQHFTKNGIKYLEIAGISAPFSFFGYVVYDPSQHTDQELNMILAHEAAHAKSGHTWDILLSKLLLVTQWFNPFAWLYAKKMEQNLEYMADASATQHTENKKGYQLAMLRTGISNQVPALSSSFYNSLIKKRVIMLNKQSSSQTSKFKLAIIVPLLTMFLYSFNYKEELKIKINTDDLASAKSDQSEEPFTSAIQETTAVQKTENEQQVPSTFDENKDFLTITIPNNSKQADLKRISREAKKNYNIELKFSGLKHNNNGIITDLKVDFTDSDQDYKDTHHFTISDDNGVKDLVFFRMENGGSGFMNMGVQTTHSQAQLENEKVYNEIRRKQEELYGSEEKENAERQKLIEERQKQVEERQKLAEERQKKAEERALVEISAHKERQYLDSINASNRSNNILIRNTQEDKVLYVLDGEVIDAEKMRYLDKNKIKSINILKDKSAIEKYGKKAEDGVVKINTKDDTPPSNIEVRSIDSNAVLYILDGEESTKATVDRLDPKTIESVSVLKNESATSLYGDKGKNGVIIVTTKVK